ncbi:MAG: pirin family protein [Pyrinomonadaceae bacterium]
MFSIRRSDERGGNDFGWLDTRYSFSFNNYYDPRFMGFRALRVINEDRIKPGRGFPTHGHSDMEIVTYVVNGSLAHKDSTGAEEQITSGEIQRMSAGTGIMHSEYNPSPDDETYLFQIWIEPSIEGLQPSYEQKKFSEEDKLGKMKLIASKDGRDGSLTISAETEVFASILNEGDELEYSIGTNRHVWIQLISGEMEVSGNTIRSGDGIAVSEEEAISIIARMPSEFLMFDLA